MKPDAEAHDLATMAAAHARAAGRLIASEPDHVKAVHQARRHIKRARSLLRALRPLARTEIARENALLRAFAHALAPLRDAHALDEAARAVGASGANGPAASQSGLVDLAALGRALQRQGKAIVRLPLDRAPKRFLAKAVRRSYRAARKAFRAYEARPEAEPLHEARKRIKDCLHLVEALAPVRPKGAHPKPGKLDRLGELMGSIRDLDLLAQRLRREAAPGHKLARIGARHIRLERAVTRAGAKTFATRPAAVERAWKRV
ncbi:CHAD domain-containing protein [Phreatobacter sp. AB_2022a]|uniref:CHAD domain-containing protein n=1 Tax=Phreatobacter sp. AB_2022a TaxID=3003134 RepID=UPI00228743C3|nr:CHAD domain-containing protein [Phreatobacter sp. AB_2022a]MCZ0738095.1 CHAD domain-containing protein [Phreatobacter sp. AB_2022a]